jgi:hypothetical protein
MGQINGGDFMATKNEIQAPELDKATIAKIVELKKLQTKYSVLENAIYVKEYELQMLKNMADAVEVDGKRLLEEIKKAQKQNGEEKQENVKQGS